MIVPEKKLRRYCSNFQEIENYEDAVSSTEQYHLHHRKEIETLEDGTTVIRSREELKDLNLYYHRPPEELIFMKCSEHKHLHSVNLSSDTKAKRSASLIGKKRSSETRAKMSAAQIGDKHHRWKGDLASEEVKRKRDLRQRKREALYNSLT